MDAPPLAAPRPGAPRWGGRPGMPAPGMAAPGPGAREPPGTGWDGVAAGAAAGEDGEPGRTWRGPPVGDGPGVAARDGPGLAARDGPGLAARDGPGLAARDVRGLPVADGAGPALRDGRGRPPEAGGTGLAVADGAGPALRDGRGRPPEAGGAGPAVAGGTGLAVAGGAGRALRDGRGRPPEAGGTGRPAGGTGRRPAARGWPRPAARGWPWRMAGDGRSGSAEEWLRGQSARGPGAPGRLRRGRVRAGGARGLRRDRHADGNPRDRGAARFHSRGPASWFGPDGPARRLALAVAVQAVPAHEADQVRPVVGVGRVDTGQRGRELVGLLRVAHGLLVVAALGQEPAVVVDALGHVVINAEGRRGANRLAVHVFLGRQRHAARGAGALDAEQVVIAGGQLALAPPRLVDGLGDGDRGRDPVPALSLEGPRGHRADECLLRPGPGNRLPRGRRMVPAVRGALPGPGIGGNTRDGGTARRVLLPGPRGRLRDPPGLRGVPGLSGMTRVPRGPSRLLVRGFRAGPRRRDEAGDRRVRDGAHGGPRRGNRACPRDRRQAALCAGAPVRLPRLLLRAGRPGRRGARRRVRCRLVRRRLERRRLIPRGWPPARRRPVVDEADHARRGQRPGVVVRVHGEVRQRVPADGVQHPARVLGDHLDVPVEQDPVPRQRGVSVSQRMPAIMGLRVLLDRDDPGGRGVRLDPHIRPGVQRPRIGRAAGDPALPAGHLGA